MASRARTTATLNPRVIIRFCCSAARAIACHQAGAPERPQHRELGRQRRYKESLKAKEKAHAGQNRVLARTDWNAIGREPAMRLFGDPFFWALVSMFGLAGADALVGSVRLARF
jgi:hypothetical protein